MARHCSRVRDPPPVDRDLILDLHRRWFETTFPADAGRFRTSLVLNRKGTAVAVEGILPAVTSACSNWTYRRAAAPDIHPFLDGNTRTTWHLRNYLLMHDGLRPLIDLNDQSE